LADALIADARVPIKSASVLCAIGNRIPQPQLNFKSYKSELSFCKLS
jgi:hypothetical protein